MPARILPLRPPAAAGRSSRNGDVAIRRERALMVGAEVSSLLAGLIVDAGGNAMAPKLCYKGQAILLLRLGVASGW